jgi:hypothetical protein
VEQHLAHPELGKYVSSLNEAKDTLAQTTMTLGTKGMSGDVVSPLLHATPYCFMFGHVACSYFMLNQAVVAYEKLQRLFEEAGAKGEEGTRAFLDRHADARFYFNKIETAKFFVANILPGIYGIARSVDMDDHSAMHALL